MLISVVGTPTPIGHWGFAAVRKIAQALLGDCHQIHAHTLDGFKDGMSTRGSRSVVFSSDFPPSAIGELLIKLNTPLVVFQESMEDAVAFLMEVRGLPFNEAAGLATHCLSSLGFLERSRNRLTFATADYDRDAAAVLEQCARFIAPDLAAERVEALCAQLLIDYQPGVHTSVREQIARCGWPSEYLPDALRARQPHTADEALRYLIEKYLPMLQGEVSKIDVDKNLLTFGQPYNPSTGVIDLTGPQRCLVSGPALHLPAGNWIAEIAFEVSENLSGNRMSIEACNHKTVLASARTDLPRNGVFACELPFAIQDDDLYATLRFSLMSGAIEGRFVLQSLVLRRLMEPGQDEGATPGRQTGAVGAGRMISAH